MIDVENYGYVVTLQAVEPANGETGMWTTLRGDNGHFEDSTLYNSKFYGEPGQTYELNWRVSNAVEHEDYVTSVSFKAMEPEIYMVLTDTIDNTYLDLYGSMPRYGANATWEILVGDDGQINNADSHEASLWGNPNETYRVQYSHTYGDAVETEVFDITLGEFAANAGVDRSVTPSTSTDPDQKIITLWASLPYGAEGKWSIISGTNGTVALANDANSLFIGAPEEIYTLQWEVEYNGLYAVDTVEFSIMGTWGRWTDPNDESEYKTVIINGIEWMAENFRYSYFYDGYEEGNWWYGHDLESTVGEGKPVSTEEERRKYGKLYPYAYAEAFIPEGWRLATYAEFETLANTYGGVTFCGPRLRVGGESGLELVCNGFYAPSDYYGTGYFNGIEVFGSFWLDNSNIDTDFGYYVESYNIEYNDDGTVQYANEAVNLSVTNKLNALGIRYVRDVD